MHPVILVAVAMLIALAIASIVVLHWRARSTLEGHESPAADSEAILVDSTAGTSR